MLDASKFTFWENGKRLTLYQDRGIIGDLSKDLGCRLRSSRMVYIISSLVLVSDGFARCFVVVVV